MKRKLMALLLVTFLLSVAGCAGDKQTSTTPTPKDTSIVVTDGLGREVKISGPVKRISTNYGIATHMIFALGMQDKLVGIDGPSQNNEFFKALLPASDTMATGGSPKDVNIEQVLALKPDLVLVPGRNQELVKSLEQRGLTVFGVIAEDFGQLKQSMLSLGTAVGKEEQARAYVKYYDDTVKFVAERNSKLKDTQLPLVYLVGPMGSLSTCSADMYQNFLIKQCGGKNAGEELKADAAGKGWVEISAEQLLKWNPDFILVPQYSGSTPEDIYNDSRFQGLKAVKDKQVLWFPSKLNPWDYPSPQAVLGIKWLAKTLHPDIYKDVDMTAEANKFFQQFYNKSFTEIGGKL